MQRSSCRPKGVFQALAKPALGAACLLAGVLAAPADAAASEADNKPRSKVDCRSIPAGAPLPAECRKSVGDADGDKIPDNVDRCPAAAEDYDGFEDDDGCPDPDNDGDGALDEEDGCPMEPEDRDGFKDADGCPELDNDGDGILDTQDLCPLEPESFDGSGDGDGCPDLLMVTQRLDPAPAAPAQHHGPERPPTMPVLPPKPAAAPNATVAAAAGSPATAGAHGAVAGGSTVGGHAVAGGHAAVGAHAAAPAAATSPARPAPPPAPAPAPGPAPAHAHEATEMMSPYGQPPAGAPRPCPAGTMATPEGKCVALDAELLRISDTIQFAQQKDVLLEASHATLDRVVDLLDTNQNLRVMVVGHADSRGQDESNLKLSMLRAMTVRAYLLQQSRDPEDLSHRLDAVGIGARQPLGSNDSAVGRSRNRRVEFIVVDRQQKLHRGPAPGSSAPAARPAAPAAHAPPPHAPAPAAHTPPPAHH
ncbi:MAG TPA: OmpA family protein [Polyangiaceae bacterium]|nr:OmpA family protein [Polyangiaceae bacterium]